LLLKKKLAMNNTASNPLLHPEQPLRFKLLAKPLNSTKYHLATFDHKLHTNCKLPRHILKEATKESIDKEIKEAAEREKVSDGATLMEEKPALARKI